MKVGWNLVGSTISLAMCLPVVWGQQCLDHPEMHIGGSVETSSGLVEGHTAPRRPAVSEYLGIPYASPPIGDLRFAAPVAYKSNGTIQATAYVRYLPVFRGVYG